MALCIYALTHCGDSDKGPCSVLLGLALPSCDLLCPTLGLLCTTRNPSAPLLDMCVYTLWYSGLFVHPMLTPPPSPEGMYAWAGRTQEEHQSRQPMYS